MKKNTVLFSATRNTIFTFAVFHLLLLAYHALQQGDINIANIFNVLDLELFVKGIDTGMTNLVLSYGVVALVFGFFYWKEKK